MKINRYFKLLLGSLLSVFLLVGCTQPSTINNSVGNPESLPPADQFEVVRKAADEYLSSGKVVSMSPDQLYEEYVEGKHAKYFLVDIRANEDFITSNIRGSVNIPYSQTMNLKKLVNLPMEKTIVVIDYNGHWAAQTAASWNMLGFDAVPLMYGIQSWTKEELPAGYEAFPSVALDYPLVQTEKSLGEYQLPELKMPEGKAEELVRVLSGSYLDRNYKGYISSEDLMEVIGDKSKVSENYLVDIRQPEHYKAGHIEGSVNIPLAELAKVELLKKIPQEQKIILIGYDGMDGSQGARVLTTLGYNAVSLKYGLSYWNGDKTMTGIESIHSLVQDYFELTPLNYAKPSSAAAGCG